MIFIKSDSEIQKMREAGRIVAHTHEVLREKVAPGVSTKELDDLARRTIEKYGAIPSFLGYGGFPAAICASVNDEVVHGIPSGGRVLQDGDLISIDIGAVKDGFHGDAARTHLIGHASEEATRLVQVTRDSFYEGLRYCREGYRLSDISHAIQAHVETNGFSVVRDLVGHGIGKALHEDPQIPNYGAPGRGPRLRRGMVLAIEPMVNIGGYAVKTLADQWTVVTLDGSLSAHYEHTVAITDGEPELLTKDGF